MAKKNVQSKQKKEFTMSREEYIQHLSMRTNEVHMTTKNSKTGCGVIDLAFPTVTCRDDAPCKQSGACYCLKGTQRMSSVLGAYYRNLRLYNENPEDFWEQVWFKLAHSGLPKCRFFDCGDIPDAPFVEGMIKTALKFPEMKFMAFTKKYTLVNMWLMEHPEGLPQNLNIIFSAWSKNWIVPNPFNLPISYIDFIDKDLNCAFPENYQTCPNQKDKTITCSMCGKCWNRNIGSIVFRQH